MAKLIKILFVTFSLDVGGLENLVLELARNLDRERFASSICTLQKGGKLQQEFERSGIPVYVIEKREGMDFFLPFKIYRLLKQKKIDIVHTNNAVPWLYVGISVLFRRRIRLIHTEHSHLPVEKELLIKAERLLSKLTFSIVADSANVAKFLSSRVNVPGRKLKTIYNGVNCKRLNININAQSKKREIGRGGSEQIVGIVGRLVLVKDHVNLLCAFKKVINEVSRVKLLIIGDGELKDYLVKYAHDLKITQKVKFLGNRFDVPDLLKTMDVFVISSLSEGFSIALLEAIASGIPVVATNVGGNAEIIEHGVSGLLVPPKDPNEISKMIVSLLKNKEMAKKIGERGQRKVRADFSFEKMKEKYQSVYYNSIN